MLNKNQQLASNALNGNVLIQAGAGTGKTTTLIARIRNLIVKKHLNPAKILAITFTNKAANHLKEEVKTVPGGNSVVACTIHSYCVKLLKMDIVLNQLPHYNAYWKIYDTNQTKNILKQCINQYYLDKIDYALDQQNLEELNNYASWYNAHHKKGFIDTAKLILNDVNAKPNKDLKSKIALAYRQYLDTQLKKAALHNIESYIYKGLDIYRLAIAKGYYQKQVNPKNNGELELNKYITELQHKYAKRVYYSGLDISDFINLIKYTVTEYVETLEKDNAMDFDGLLYNSVIALSSSNAVLEKIKSYWQSISIDEYQDVSNIQEMLISLLSNDNLCAVGDPNQSIYAFRGANVNNIISFKNKFKDTQIIKLDDNYRSTQAILDMATSLIEHNTNKTLENIHLKGHQAFNNDKPKLTKYLSVKSEINAIAHKIKELHSKGVNYNQIGILYGMNKTGENVAKGFVKYNIPYHLTKAVVFKELPEIKTTLSYASIVLNHNDNDSFKDAVMTPDRGLGVKSLQAVEDYANSNDANNSMFNSLVHVSSMRTAKGRKLHREIQEALLKMYQELTEISKTDYNELNKLLLDLCDKYVCPIKNYDPKLLSEAGQNCLILLEKAKQIDNEMWQLNIADRLKELNNELALNDSEETQSETDNSTDNDKVELMTIHKAKGLEFDYVFLINLNDGQCPFYRQDQELTKQELEEERRKLYVGITRARKELYCSFTQYNIWGRYTEPSRFINEINFDLFDYDDQAEKESQRLLNANKQKMS